MSKARDELAAVYGRLEDKYQDQHKMPRKQHLMMVRILILLNTAYCRSCKDMYDVHHSRAEYTGYCSARCMHVKARSFGWRKNGPRTEYDVLHAGGATGNDYVIP